MRFRRQGADRPITINPAHVYFRLAADQQDDLPAETVSPSRKALAVVGAAAIAFFAPWALAERAFAHGKGQGKVDFGRKHDSGGGDSQGEHKGHGNGPDNGKHKGKEKHQGNASATANSPSAQSGKGASGGQPKHQGNASATANSPSAQSGKGASGGQPKGSATANSPSAQSGKGKSGHG